MVENIISKEAREEKQKEITEMYTDIEYWIRNYVFVSDLDIQDTMDLYLIICNLWQWFYIRYSRKIQEREDSKQEQS